jgi:hypothetical protein
LEHMAAYIGLDWADERHSVHLQTAEGVIEHRELEQKPAVLHEWVAQLQQRFAGGKIAVALEQRKGAVIHALLMYYRPAGSPFPQIPSLTRLAAVSATCRTSVFDQL